MMSGRVYKNNLRLSSNRPGEKEKFFLMINVETENYMAYDSYFDCMITV